MIDPVANDQMSFDQADYLKLFLQELKFQDPMKPIDNKDFMAQMAQFSSLQESRKTNENMVHLLTMRSASQAVNLLGKKVYTHDDGPGVVKTVRLEKSGPVLRVDFNSSFSAHDSAKVREIKMNDIEKIEG